MIMHSSPIEWWESWPCRGMKVEETSAAELEQCHMALSSSTFISVPYLLSQTQNKSTLMLCVKRSQDVPAAIQVLMAEPNAINFAFLEVDVSDIKDLFTQQVKDWDKVFYVVKLSTPNDVATVISWPENVRKRTFMGEFLKWDENWTEVQLDESITALHQAGIRTFAMSKHFKPLANERNQQMMLEKFDVVYSYNLEAAVKAREVVKKERGFIN